MRQAGVLAACCLYGLEHLKEHLKKDLANARRLAEGSETYRKLAYFRIIFSFL
jgi:hypothetical protein